jgi:hypothetical protein
MVEAQHIASTMKIVDTRDEQDLLESLLESSKPAQSIEAQQLDYLLATPFRYDPLRGGSRFRGVIDPGVFYGAASVRTAAAELGFWRWKFLQDAVDLERLEPVAHTAFRADIATTVVDLRKAPFDVAQDVWLHPTDYTATQAFARVARDAKVGGIVYRSVRDPQPAWCLALLTAAGFSKPKPSPQLQTWFLAVSKHEVTWRRDHEAMQFSAIEWQETRVGQSVRCGRNAKVSGVTPC